MRNETFRRPSVLAAITGFAILASLAGSGRAQAAPPAPATSQKVQAALPAVKQPPPEVLDRLRKVGLNPADPSFASKLRTLAASTGASFVKSHVMSSTATRRGGASRAGGAGSAGGVSQSVSSIRVSPGVMPVTGTVVAAYDDTPSQLSNPAPISSTHGKTWPGRYFFLVQTKQKINAKGGPGFSFGSTSLSYGCSAQLGIIMTTGAAADDPNFTYGLQKLPPAGGVYSYYVLVDFTYLPIGQQRNTQATISFENVTAPTSLVLQPTPGDVTLSVTIDHSPQLTGAGLVYPWGGPGFSGSNAKLGSTSTARVGGGDWQTQTQGDDLVGVGVGIGPGWTVTSTKVTSAVSATSPQDLSPDNIWRGAKVTTAPVGNDLRTAVHWHYSGVDSLDYTIQWTLSGPLGQRPILTLPKYGSCDS